MKKFLLALLLPLFLPAAHADVPPDWIYWQTFALRTFADGQPGEYAVLVVGSTNVLNVQAEMSDPTFDVLDSGSSGVFDSGTFYSIGGLGVIASGTPAMLVVEVGRSAPDYYGDSTTTYAVYEGIVSGSNFYVDDEQTTFWNQHCTGGEPNFGSDYMNVQKVDSFAALGLADLVPAGLDNPAGSLSGSEAMYSGTTRTIYVLNRYVGGVRVDWDATTISSVRYQLGVISSTNTYYYWLATGKTNGNGSQFGWLETEDPENPTTVAPSP